MERTDAAVLAAAGYAATETSRAIAPGAITLIRLRLPLGTTTWTELGARGELLLPEIDQTVGPLWAVLAVVGAGFAF